MLAESRAAPLARPLGERLLARHLLTHERITEILDLQRRCGCRFGEAALALGVLAPADLAEALAEQLGLAFADLRYEPADPALSAEEHLSLYLRHMFLPWRRIGDALIIACADPGPETESAVRALYGAEARIAVTSKFDVVWAIESIFREYLAREASEGLAETLPRLSAKSRSRRLRTFLILGTLTALGALMIGHRASYDAALAMTLLIYGANLSLRTLLFAAGWGRENTGIRIDAGSLAALDERSLPMISILVPLYREAGMIVPLARGLKRLDYPPTKLDIKLILEEDDEETIAAAKAAGLDARFEILRVPAGLPRTKPRACNYALPFARGAYTVIYDAEDQPEPDQLKKAVAAFRASKPDVACLQARLNFYNAKENWLTRLFALEYASWFDFVLPGMARFHMPIPLGGTSNHFRTDILRRAGGWDAYNVTEDADLGVRLARLGYRVLPLDSSTYEEATATFGSWVRQRSRWLKGYMQTGLVHARDTRGFARTIGAARLSALFVLLWSGPVTGLMGPIFWLLFLQSVWRGEVLAQGFTPMLAFSLASLVLGTGVAVVLAMLSPAKRRWRALAPYGVTLPVYWLLISVAAYRALWQLATRPFYWEKTDHGVTRLLWPQARAATRLREYILRAARLFAVLAILSMAGTHDAFSSAWLLGADRVEMIVNLLTSQFTGGFGGTSISDARQATVSAHIEYGVSDDVTAVLDGGEQWFGSGASVFNAHLDKAVLGARMALADWDGGIASADLRLGGSEVYGPLGPADVHAEPIAEMRLGIGQGFDIGEHHGFVDFETGSRWRGGAPADEAMMDITLGLDVWRGTLLLLQSFSTVSIGHAAPPYQPYALHKYQISIVENLWGDIWMQTGYFGTFGRYRAQDERGFVTALWWRFAI